MATYYLDSVDGNDSNDGLSTETAWKTIGKINIVALSSTGFSPGDNILFKRGQTWRGTLWCQDSGSTGSPITVGTYGTGDKPKLLGSINLDNTGYWEDLGSNVWMFDYLCGTGTNLITNSSFTTDTSDWYTINAGTANASQTRDTSTYYSSPASLRVSCTDNGASATDIRVMFGPLTIVEDTEYVIRFRAKASTNMAVLPQLIEYDDDYTNYAPDYNTALNITTDWQSFQVKMTVNASASDVALMIFMGTQLPESGSGLWIDNVSMKSVGLENPFLSDWNKTIGGNYDIGNLILNNENAVGYRQFALVDTDAQGDYYFESQAGLLYVYSTSNPATYYSNIEAACYSSGIYTTTHHQVYENLDIRYHGVMGVSGESGSHNITVQDCDISFCGGAYLLAELGGFYNIRYGNGIQMWNNIHDWTIRRNRISEIYDTGITNQGNNEYTAGYNIYVYNNLISKCCWGIEQCPSGGDTQDVYYEYNTIVSCGKEKTHDQRNNFKYGSGYRNPYDPGTITRVYVRNNLFYDCLDASIDQSYVSFYQDAQISDYNLFYSTTGLLADFTDMNQHPGDTFTYSELEDLITTTGQEEHSLVADPKLVSTSDYSLQSDSAARGKAQVSTICTTDFTGRTRSATSPCIGAYEFFSTNQLTSAFFQFFD